MLLTVFALLLPAGAALAGGFNLAGVGAKALSMSGSFRAIADDWSAMYWNPAGLAGQSSGFVLEGKVLYPMTWLTPQAPSSIPGNSNYYLYENGVERSSVAETFPAGALAFQWKMNDRMTFGISAFAPSALGATWKGLFLGPYYGYGNDQYPEDAWTSSMQVIDIHPTVGYQVTDKLKAGLGLGIKYAAIKLQSPNVLPSNDGTGSRLPMPAQDFFVDGILDGTGIGFGFNLGLLYDITEQFHLGVTFNGPTTIPIKGTVKQTLYMPSIAGGGTSEVEPDATADFPLPMEVGGGLAYDVNDRLTIAGDVNWTNWKALDKVTVALDGDGLGGQPAEDTELELLWENTIRYNVGANYKLIPEKGLELRLGWYYDPTPIPPKTLRPTITDVADKNNISIGGAYNLTKMLQLEAYWEHVMSGEQKAGARDNNGDGMYDNVPGTWKMQVDTFGFQLTYRF